MHNQRVSDEKNISTIDWNDVVFEIDLIKSQEINLDFILELILENSKKFEDKTKVIEEMQRMVRSTQKNRAKEPLLIDFINTIEINEALDKSGIIDAFFDFAKAELKREIDELINNLSLNEDNAKRYITKSLQKQFADDKGTEINGIFPSYSPLNSKHRENKRRVHQRIVEFVAKYAGVGDAVNH